MPYDASTDIADQIIESCEKHWSRFKSDCSGFVKAVASDFGIQLSGDANLIVKSISTSWVLATDGAAAARQAAAGNLVIAGLAETDGTHGHVAIVVQGSVLRGKYPTGYWGRLGGQGAKKKTLNYAWGPEERDSVEYYYKKIANLTS